MLGNNVSGTPEIAISVRTNVLIIVRIFSTFSITKKMNENINNSISQIFTLSFSRPTFRGFPQMSI